MMHKLMRKYTGRFFLKVDYFAIYNTSKVFKLQLFKNVGCLPSYDTYQHFLDADAHDDHYHVNKKKAEDSTMHLITKTMEIVRCRVLKKDQNQELACVIL